MFSLQVKSNQVTVKTNLNHYEILAHTEKILRIKEWQDSMSNRVRAKIILESMIILENHLLNLWEYSMMSIPHPLTIRHDFNELWAMLYRSQRDN